MSGKLEYLCEECENYSEDEETGECCCIMLDTLDQDEYADISRGGRRCPMFRFKDEYRLVRKQN